MITIVTIEVYLLNSHYILVVKGDNMPNYPLIDPKDLVRRDQIKLDPKNDLEALTYVQFKNIREGTQYKLFVEDTRENREKIALTAMYYQQAAYMEGWEFNPDNYQVNFLPKGDPMLGDQPNTETRVYDFGESNNPDEREREGFRRRLDSDIATRIKEPEAEQIYWKAKKFQTKDDGDWEKKPKRTGKLIAFPGK